MGSRFFYSIQKILNKENRKTFVDKKSHEVLYDVTQKMFIHFPEENVVEVTEIQN